MSNNTDSPRQESKNLDTLEGLHSEAEVLRAENQKLKKINRVLVQRVDMGIGNQSAAYQSFETAVLLTDKVRQRTATLQSTLDKLEKSNHALSEAQLESEASQQRVIDAIESISDAFVLFNNEDKMLLANYRFIDLGAELKINLSIGRTTPDDVREAIDISNYNYPTDEEDEIGILNETDEQRIFKVKDGGWWQMSQRPTVDGGLVIVCSDITAIKENETRVREQALTAKSRVLQSTLDNISQGIALVNPEGQLEAWNNSFELISGWCPPVGSAELNFSKVQANSEVELSVSPDYSEAIYELEKVLLDERVIEIKHHRISTGGFVNTYTDTTERSKNEAALSESEHRIRLITDAMPALISYIRSDSCYEFVNRAFVEWFKKPSSEIVNQPLSNVIGKDEYNEHKPYVTKAMLGEVVNFEMEQLMPDRGKLIFQKTYVPHFDINNNVLGIFALEQDVTQHRRTSQALNNAYQTLEQRVQERTKELQNLNKQLEREIWERAKIEKDLIDAKLVAEEANISKTKFLATISHDLLQPMNAAKLFVSALKETSQTGNVGELVSSLDFSLLNMESLLDSLVNISKLDAGVVQAVNDSFCVNELLENLAIESRSKSKGAGVLFEYIPCQAIVYSDSQLLARIIRNFLSNALRYTENGKVVLGCRRRPNGLEIQVIDNGCGISESMFEEVFKEFKRGEAPNKQDRGLGLGLAIVKKIAAVLDHQIKIQSELDKGSLFSVLVAYGELQPGSKNKTAMIEPTNLNMFTGKRILVVDNDRLICDGMDKLLSLWGCEVKVATSVDDLVQNKDLLSETIDLLIVDYHLDDDETGFDVIDYVRQFSSAPVVVITAIYTNEFRQETARLGYHLLNKPLKPMKLRSLLRHLF